MSFNKQIPKKYTRAAGIIIIVVIFVYIAYGYEEKCCSGSIWSGTYCSECNFFSYFKQTVLSPIYLLLLPILILLFK